MALYYTVLCVFSFIVGSCIGSFLNVCIYRIPQKLSVAAGRSFCPSCDTPIKPYDLIPILSYILLRGKCRSCGARISPRYIIVEALTGALFAATAAIYGLTLLTPLYLVFICCLICVAFIDAEHMYIPDRFNLVIALLALPGFFLQPGVLWYERLIGAAAIALPMFLIGVFFSGFGFGDVKLMAACGLLMGWKLSLLAFILAAVAAAAVAAVKLLKKTAKAKERMAFGPFIAGGFTAAALIGQPILDWYLSFLW